MINKLINYCKNNKYLFISIVILILYLLPYFIFQENSHILVHDNLDSLLVNFKLLSSSGQIFGSLDSIFPNYMNGIPRNVLGTEFNLILWLFVFFKPYVAYIINLVLIHSIAFLGMYLLMKKHFIKEPENKLIVIGVSLCFALLPFYPMVGLSVAGLPLALYIFLNIRSNKYKKIDLILLFLIPLYSSFVLSFIFFLTLVFLLWLYDFVWKRKRNLFFLIIIMLMTLEYLVIEYRLVYNMFFNNTFISYRAEYLLDTYNFIKALKVGFNNFLYGQYHAPSLQQYFVIIALIIAITIMFLKKILERRFIILFIVIITISLWYGFWRWEGFNKIIVSNFFNFSRFHWLHPLLWYILFGLSLCLIKKYLKFGKWIVIILVVLQIVFLFYNNSEFTERRKGNPTYREFFAEELLNEVKEYIGQNQKEYRVVSIGLHPSVTQYSGFYTLDAFLTNYSLEYKHKFRKTIENELDKNEELKSYFDNFGGRCYIFVDELGLDFMYTKFRKKVINNLNLNTNILKEMGCEYIFSAVEISNNKDNNLNLLRIFEDNKSTWQIYLYKIN